MFPSASEAGRVLREGKRDWQGGRLLLDVWHPMAGYRRSEKEEEGMVWINGLSLHLWSRITFEKIGEFCGGLMGFEIKDPGSMEWVALKVQESELAPEWLWLCDEMMLYWIQIWKRKSLKAYPTMTLNHFKKGREERGWNEQK